MRASALVVCLFVFAVGSPIAVAEPVEFPYEAVAATDGVVVRSGPGERYDPTMNLKAGDPVTVHRHEPGGWFMISPPPGSFSWIDATYVQKSGPDTGLVSVPSQGDGLPPRVVVWIGSQFNDEHKYFGRQLATGDDVRILGEKQGVTDRGPTTFYKIAPPRLEFRWVKGDFIVPKAEAGNIARSTPVATPPVSTNLNQNDPFSNTTLNNSPLAAPGFPPEPSPTLLERDLTRGIDAGAVSINTTPATSTPAERSQLYALDDKLKTMLAQTPDHWDLAGMEQSYRQLQSTAGVSVASQIDARLAALQSRQKIKAEYDAFVGIISETERRDATLLSMRQSIAAGNPLSSIPVDLGSPTSFPPQLSVGPESAIGSVQQQPAFGPSGAIPDQPSQAVVPQMDGAGIVHRLSRPAPGFPQYILVAPDGRPLAYLTPGQGVRLDDYLGKSMGIIGKRSHDARLRSDVIVVERLTPVQLQP